MPDAIATPPAPTPGIVAETVAPRPELGPEPPPMRATPKRDKMFEEMDKIGETKPTTETPKTEKPPVEKKEVEEPETPEVKDDKSEVKTTEEKPKKANPWKLYDDSKKRISELEKQLAESGKTGLAQEEKAQLQSRIELIEKRNKELEDEIRYVDYSKSTEFREKYEKPHEEAWGKALSELGELTVEENGVERPFNGKDLLNVVNLPLKEARSLADEQFGTFANDVMAHRKEIKRLFQAKAESETKARTEGAERIKQQQETQTRQRSEIERTLAETWKKANEEIVKDESFGRFFAPDEADPETKVRLEKGFKLVDEAFAMNALDPNLSPEQREIGVRKHAALRNRAAAFGRLVYSLTKTEKENASLKAKLAEYEATEPSTTGGRKAPETAKPAGRASDRLFAALDNLVPG